MRLRLASRHWEPLLRKWKGWLSGSSAHREQAEEHLATVTDPHAVPSILKVFPIGGLRPISPTSSGCSRRSTTRDRRGPWPSWP